MIFYFGCHRGPGHYLYEIQQGRFITSRHPEVMLPPCFRPEAIDQKIQPVTNHRQGAAALIQAQNFTALSWHDFTVDSRPGSSSTLICSGTLSFDEMLAVLRLHLPSVSDRQPRTAPIFLVPLS
jgi:hypothetical protein